MVVVVAPTPPREESARAPLRCAASDETRANDSRKVITELATTDARYPPTHLGASPCRTRALARRRPSPRHLGGNVIHNRNPAREEPSARAG